jgi:hypothetical protein
MPKYVLTWNFSTLRSRVSTCRREMGSAIGRIVAAGRGRDVVVGGGEDRSDAPRVPVRHLQALEGLGAGHLVDDVAVDVEQRGAVRALADDVGIPELFVEGARQSCTQFYALPHVERIHHDVGPIGVDHLER